MDLSGVIKFSGNAIGDIVIKIDDFSFTDEKSFKYQSNKKTGYNNSVFLFMELNSLKSELFCTKHTNLDSLDYYAFTESLFDLDLQFGAWISKKEEKILLVRDILGLIPLYYYRSQNELLFSASYVDLLELLKSKEKTLTVDKLSIGNYITDAGAKNCADQSTFFKEIKSVYPGHYIEFTSDSSKQVSYLNFQPEKYSHEVDTTVKAGSRFKEKLQQSILNNIPSSSLNKLGVQLSGGLDSSCIAGLLRELFPSNEINTFFLQATKESNVDTKYAKLVSDYIDSNHVIIEPKEGIEHYFIETIRYFGMPTCLVSGGLPGYFVREAAAYSEVDVVLSGQGGDEVVGYGNDYLEKLFADNNWGEILSIAREMVRKDLPVSKEDIYTKKSDQEKEILLFNGIIFSLLRPRKEILFTLRKLLSIGRFDTVKHYVYRLYQLLIKKNKRTSSLDDRDLVTKELYSILSRNNRFSSYLNRRSLVTQSGIDFSGIYLSSFINIYEVIHSLNQNHFAKIYTPFLSKNLLELSLAVPSKIKFANGLKRGHLREVMKDILPEEVVNRYDKFVFSLFVKKVCLKMHDNIEDLLVEDSEVWRYANYNYYNSTIKILRSNDDDDYGVEKQRLSKYAIRVISLAIWLEEFKQYYR